VLKYAEVNFTTSQSHYPPCCVDNAQCEFADCWTGCVHKRRIAHTSRFLAAATADNFYRAILCMRSTSHGPVSVCLCLSVTSRSSTKTAKRRITQTTPHDSPGILVFWCQRPPRNSTGVPPTMVPNAGGVGHICSPSSMLLNCPVRQRLWSHGNMALYKFCIVLYCIVKSATFDK